LPEYWVIDVDNRKLIAFHDPESLPEALAATVYRTRLSFDPD
jgi:hypothetical protein